MGSMELLRVAMMTFLWSLFVFVVAKDDEATKEEIDMRTSIVIPRFSNVDKDSFEKSLPIIQEPSIRDLQGLPDWSCANFNGDQILCDVRTGCYYTDGKFLDLRTSQSDRDRCTIFPIQQGCTWTNDENSPFRGSCSQSGPIVMSDCKSNKNASVCTTIPGCFLENTTCTSPCEVFNRDNRRNDCQDQQGCRLVFSRYEAYCYQNGPIVVMDSTTRASVVPKPTPVPSTKPSVEPKSTSIPMTLELLTDWSCANFDGNLTLCERRTGCTYAFDEGECRSGCTFETTRYGCTVYPYQQGCTWTEDANAPSGGGSCSQSGPIVMSNCKSNKNVSVCTTVPGCFLEDGTCNSPCETMDREKRRTDCENQPGCRLVFSRSNSFCYQNGLIVVQPTPKPTIVTPRPTPPLPSPKPSPGSSKPITTRPTPPLPSTKPSPGSSKPITTRPTPPLPSTKPSPGSSKPITTPSSSCEICPNGFEYRFNARQEDWDLHRKLAQEQDCFLATIGSSEEQAAAVKAMEPYIGHMYRYRDDFHGSFAFLGGQTVKYYSDPTEGRYVFASEDGGWLEAYRGDNSRGRYIDLDSDIESMGPAYTNFIPSDPNGLIQGYGQELYLALSLGENDLKDTPRGAWIDVPNRKCPALYKCCASDFPTCALD